MSESKLYLVIAQRQCDDSYYRPYQDVIAAFKSREKAVNYARQMYTHGKKYMFSDDCYMVDESKFADDQQWCKRGKNTIFVIDREGLETTVFE